jgi:glycosyltransferase involved in cell wall biosynthesis
MQRQLVRDDLTVGIIIPFFKNVAYLCELLNSIHNQSCQNYEVLLVDDSPKQRLKMRDVVNDLGVKYSILENGENLGPFATWNNGLREMIGREKYCLMAIVHEDDLLHRDYIKNSLDYYVNYPEIDVFHSKVRIIGHKGSRKFSIQDTYKNLVKQGFCGKPLFTALDDGLSRVLRNNYIFCPSMIFNVSKFSEIEFDTRWEMVGDLDFISKALLDGRKILRLPDKNYFYRRHNDNLTAELTRTSKRFEEEIQLYKELEMKCLENGYVKSAMASKRARVIKLHIIYRISLALFRFDFVNIRILFSNLLTVGR